MEMGEQQVQEIDTSQMSPWEFKVYELSKRRGDRIVYHGHMPTPEVEPTRYIPDIPPIIEPEAFVPAMEKHWTEELGNVSSAALRKVWKQLALNLNVHIEEDHPGIQRTWNIIQPPTGTGKTEGVMLYCAMLSEFPDEEHPGVLIITRLQADCEMLAERINHYGVRPTAQAYHSNLLDIGITTLWRYPVAVITHSAYQRAMDFFKTGIRGKLNKFQLFMEYFAPDRERRLIVVDECLDIVEEDKITFDHLNSVKGQITEELARMFPEEFEAVEKVLKIFEEISRESKEPNGERLYQKEPLTLSFGDPPDLTEFRAAFLRRCQDRAHFNEEYLNKLDERLKTIHYLYRGYVYYAKVEGKDTLSTARLLIPDGIKGACVLDATAESNKIYRLLFGKMIVVGAPEGSRNYQNVTIHVSHNHHTGKRYMEKNAGKISGELVSHLEKILRPDRKVLVVTHKGVEAPLNSFTPSFTMMTTHWSMHTGTNAFRDCDTVVIFGLNWRPQTWTANTYFAIQGTEKDILNGDDTSFGEDDNIREALEIGQFIVDITQAINRSRCRKVIDSRGNCPKAEVYILLPGGPKGKKYSEQILRGLQRQMPGVMLKQWAYGVQKASVKRSSKDKALITYLRNMHRGTCQSTGDIRKRLKIAPRSMYYLTKQAQDPDSDLHSAMVELGVSYITRREGRTVRAYFQKS